MQGDIHKNSSRNICISSDFTCIWSGRMQILIFRAYNLGWIQKMFDPTSEQEGKVMSCLSFM